MDFNANVSLPSIASEWPSPTAYTPSSPYDASRRSYAPSPSPSSPFVSSLLSAPLPSTQSYLSDAQSYFSLPIHTVSEDPMKEYTIPASAMSLPHTPARRPVILRSATDQPKKRIPRPPNAFMLFRSWLIKNKKVPDDVEKRQQNLSRIAGRCWQMLREEEKNHWKEEAKKVFEAHKNRHPDYKFTPAPKGAGRAGKLRREEELDGEVVDDAMRIQILAEMCCPELKGREVAPSRRRATPKVKKQEFDHVNFETLLSYPSSSYSDASSTSSPTSYPPSLVSGSPAMSFSSSPPSSSTSSPVTPATAFHYPPYAFPESYAYAPSRVGLSSPSLGQFEMPYASFDYDQTPTSMNFQMSYAPATICPPGPGPYTYEAPSLQYPAPYPGVNSLMGLQNQTLQLPYSNVYPCQLSASPLNSHEEYFHANTEYAKSMTFENMASISELPDTASPTSYNIEDQFLPSMLKLESPSSSRPQTPAGQ